MTEPKAARSLAAVLLIASAAVLVAVAGAVMRWFPSDEAPTAQIPASAGDPRPLPTAIATTTPTSTPTSTPIAPPSEMGAPLAGESLAKTNRVVERLQPDFRRCYQEGVRAQPDMAGAVTLTVRIAPDGSVEAVTGTAALGPIVECLKSVLRAAQFPPPEPPGSTAVIQVPLVFGKR